MYTNSISVLGSSSSSSCCSRSCCGQRLCSGAAAPTAVTAAARHRGTQCVTAQLQQQQPIKQQQQQFPVLLPRQQQQHQQQLLQHQPLWPQQWHGQPSRCSVVAAAGRRRRQDVGGDEEDPDLDMDDVMYANDGDVEDTDVLGGDTAEDFGDDFDDVEDAEEEDEYAEGEEDDEEGRADDDWAAALDDFDTALDAQAVEEQGPSKEEQELAAAKAMVRFDDDVGDFDGTSLIISEIPPEEPDRPKTFDEQTEALSPQDKQTLEQNMAAYTVFPMHELDLLVSSTADGRLVLSDCFCLDTVEDSFVRPSISDGIPASAGLYQVIPWEHTKTGDLLKHKDPEVQRVKLYFIGLHSASPHEVDMSSIYSFDAARRMMVPHTPQVLGADKHEDMFDPVMRIREDGVWIEEAQVLPGNFFIAEGFAGHPLDRYNNPDKLFDMHEFVKMGLWDKPRSMEELRAAERGSTAVAVAAAAAAEEGGAMDTVAESQLEERLEELELMEELDDMPDVPAVDMM